MRPPHAFQQILLQERRAIPKRAALLATSLRGLLASPRRVHDVGTRPVRHDEADPRWTGRSALRVGGFRDTSSAYRRPLTDEVWFVAPTSPLDWPHRVSFVVLAFWRLGAPAAPCSKLASRGGECCVSVSYAPSLTARLQNVMFVHRFLGRNRPARPLEPGNRKVSKVKCPLAKSFRGQILPRPVFDAKSCRFIAAYRAQARTARSRKTTLKRRPVARRKSSNAPSGSKMSGFDVVLLNSRRPFARSNSKSRTLSSADRADFVRPRTLSMKSLTFSKEGAPQIF